MINWSVFWSWECQPKDYSTLPTSTTKASSAGDWHSLNDFQQRYTSTYNHNKRRTNYLDECLGTRVEWSTYPQYRTVIGIHSSKPTRLWSLMAATYVTGFCGNDNIDNHITLDTYDSSLFINHISWQPSIDTHTHTHINLNSANTSVTSYDLSSSPTPVCRINHEGYQDPIQCRYITVPLPTIQLWR